MKARMQKGYKEKLENNHGVYKHFCVHDDVKWTFPCLSGKCMWKIYLASDNCSEEIFLLFNQTEVVGCTNEKNMKSHDS